MNKIFLILIVLGLLTTTIMFLVNESKDGSKEEKQLYQGPVPEGYDEDYFRKTGITKPLEDSE